MTDSLRGNSPSVDKVQVKTRALVQKCLARYPDKFAVFRELLQNADDAEAEVVQIAFQTKEYTAIIDKAGKIGIPENDLLYEECGTSLTESINGKKLGVFKLNGLELSRWIVRNNGKCFNSQDWKRLKTIADGNPYKQRIGSFGVGFFSVFGITDNPTIISGGEQMKMFYGRQDQQQDPDQLFAESSKCDQDDGWTTFKMDLKLDAASKTVPELFGLLQYINTAMAFLGHIKKVSISLNEHCHAIISKSSEDHETMILPAHLLMQDWIHIQTVKTIAQEVKVMLSSLAYSEGLDLQQPQDEDEDDLTKPDVAGQIQHAEEQHKYLLLQRSFSAQYSVYSAEIQCSPSNDMKKRIQTATMKDPPVHSHFQVIYFSKEQHDHIRNNKVHNTIFGEENGLLCSEGQGRLFVGQSTVQTTGVSLHLSGRFIPTMERESIDLVCDQVQQWNEGLLYVGGFLLRLIYETAMDAVGNMTPDLAQLWGLFIMKSFAFQKSTPHPRVCEVLREAFFKCSTCNSIPVLSDVGIRDSKDVTLPDERYSPFMKQLPVLDDDINGHDLPIIKALLKRHSLLRFKYRWVIEILENQPLTTAEDRDSFFRWFMHEFKPPLQEKMSKFRDEIIRVAQLMHDNSDKVIKLKAIKRFISHDGWGSELQDDDALPSNTIPHSFTAQFGREVLRITFGWEALGIIEWIQNIICRPDIVDHHVSRVFRILQSQWSLLEPLHREKIVRLICETECIPTNLGRTTPEKAYFLESPQFRNLLHDLPLAQLSDIDPQLVEDLGFKQIIPWYHLKECLPKIACHTHQIAPYFGRAYGKMAEAEVKELQQMYIFASEEGELHRIGDLHIPDAEGLYLRLQLPIIQDSSGHNSQQVLEPLKKMGLRSNPELGVLINKACNSDENIRQSAFGYLVANLGRLYCDYKPEDFLDCAFIPCEHAGATKTHLGTPEQVVIDHRWELLGFKIPHHSLDKVTVTHLKIEKKPSIKAIVDVLRRSPLETQDVAQRCFELFATTLTPEEAKELANLDIVPITDLKTNSLKQVRAHECFLDGPMESNKHHRHLFNFSPFSSSAADFLAMCGARRGPNPVDIIEALRERAQDYLEIVGSQDYRSTLRQVAFAYHAGALPNSVIDELRSSEIFLGCQKPNPANISEKSVNWVLRKVSDLFIENDSESRRLFGHHVTLSPNDKLLQDLYEAMGAKDLDSCIRCTIKAKEFRSGDQKSSHKVYGNLHKHILDRIELFLQNYDRENQYHGNSTEWHETLVIKHCRKVDLCKDLYLGDVRVAHQYTQALAGLEVKDEKHSVLWVKVENDPPTYKLWYDVAVAMCPVLIKTPNMQDKCTLATILEADLEALRVRGFDVDSISQCPSQDKPEAENKLEELDGKAAQGQERGTLPEAEGLPKRPSQSRRNGRYSGMLQWAKNKLPWTRNKHSQYSSMPIEHIDVNEVIKLCHSKDLLRETVINKAETRRREWKKRDVKHCSDSCHTKLQPCGTTSDMYGMPILKDSSSTGLPEEELRAFSDILQGLQQVFNVPGCPSLPLHIVWWCDNKSLRGYNQNGAIYLNLAHFIKEHYHRSSNDSDRAEVYTTWFFVVAHEIAHNRVGLHDENHEQLLITIATNKLSHFRELLDRVAPNAMY